MERKTDGDFESGNQYEKGRELRNKKRKSPRKECSIKKSSSLKLLYGRYTKCVTTCDPVYVSCNSVPEWKI